MSYSKSKIKASNLRLRVMVINLKIYGAMKGGCCRNCCLYIILLPLPSGPLDQPLGNVGVHNLTTTIHYRLPDDVASFLKLIREKDEMIKMTFIITNILAFLYS